MKGFVQDIEEIAVRNIDFRQVHYTAKRCQLVIMALKPNEEIGLEVHQLDQFFRMEEGSKRSPITPNASKRNTGKRSRKNCNRSQGIW